VNSLGYDIKLTAINHWDVAIATHTKNHEDVEHFCQSIDTMIPKILSRAAVCSCSLPVLNARIIRVPAAVSLGRTRSGRMHGC
jgi:hypothetical protein